jgi:hypothetical protein
VQVLLFFFHSNSAKEKMLEFLDFASLYQLSLSFDLQDEKFDSAFLQDHKLELVPEPEWTADIEEPSSWLIWINLAKNNVLSLWYGGRPDGDEQVDNWRSFPAKIILLDLVGNALLLVLCSDLSVHFLSDPDYDPLLRPRKGEDAYASSINFLSRVIEEAHSLRDQVTGAIVERLPMDRTHPIPRDKLTALLGKLSLFTLQKLRSQVLDVIDDTWLNLIDTYKQQETLRKHSVSTGTDICNNFYRIWRCWK